MIAAHLAHFLISKAGLYSMYYPRLLDLRSARHLHRSDRKMSKVMTSPFYDYLCTVAKVTIYTDGAAKGNPGRGGYGVVLLAPAREGVPPRRKELSAGYRITTNNRMELLAVIEGLEALKYEGCEVTIYSDSRYVVDAVEKGWVLGWERKNFSGKKNPDLWARFLRAYRRHRVRFVWVKGHAGNPENERCDQLAVAAAESGRLLEDTGYSQ